MRRSLLFVAFLLAARQLAAWPHAVVPPAPPSDIYNVFFSDYGRPIVVAPGDTKQMGLIEFTDSLWPFGPRPAHGIDVSWTIEPIWHATIDPRGRLSIPSTESSGVTYTVYANLNHGQRIISTTVFVYRTGGNPFFDSGWRERATIACDGSADVPIAESARINEFFFRIDGTYQVTWLPFEAYVDYWGPYRFNLEKHKMTMAISGGNYIPDDTRGEGTFEIVNSGPPTITSWGAKQQPVQLRLKGIWLGTQRGVTPPATPPCGMVFDGALPIP